MRAHIVVDSISKDWVISRLTKYLVKGLGWSHGKIPDSKADVNVFFPYLEWRHFGWKATKTAAWFTHERQTEWGHKVWKDTAAAIDLCVTPAKLYLERLPKSSVQIPHPVDLKHFTIEGPQAFRSREFVLGVSGIVNPNDKRKGEDLVTGLTNWGYKIFASGKGWPCPTHWYLWEEMPLFYRSLDVFLVTSTVEGGPVTVLEAMACGKPCVVPEDVGQCSEYVGEEGGAVGYVRGSNDENVIDAIEEAKHRGLTDSPYWYREQAARFPVHHWCADWKIALERLMDGEV